MYAHLRDYAGISEDPVLNLRHLSLTQSGTGQVLDEVAVLAAVRERNVVERT